MKRYAVMIMGLAMLAFFGGCGSSDTKGITPEMIEGKTLYTFDEAGDTWIRVTFGADRTLVYEWDGMTEEGGTYEVASGKIVVTDNSKNPVVTLLNRTADVWNVEGRDDDGKRWVDTWYFEQPFSAAELVGKLFWGTYDDPNGEPVKEILAFFESTLKVHNGEGQLLEEDPYVIENGVMTVTAAAETYALHLMFIDEAGRYHTWFSGALDSGPGVWKVIPSVNGPAAGASGATEFSEAIVNGQAIYYYDETKNLWIAVYMLNGQLLFEYEAGEEPVGTYSVEDGKIVTHDGGQDPVIVLDEARATQWDVTGTGNDSVVWHDTWYLERVFTPEMVSGKSFESHFARDGVPISETYVFADTTIKVYDGTGTFEYEAPYAIEDNAIIVQQAEETFQLFLMFVDDEENYNVWYLGSDRSGSSVWHEVK